VPKLQADLLAYLGELVTITQPRDKAAFVADHLLCTLVGALVTPNGGVIFASGDGLVHVDGQTIIRTQNNTPDYLAYRLLGLGGADVDLYPLTANWGRVAIATDGFEVDLLGEVWGNPHPRALQRRFNRWSDQDHRFADDATLIVVER
jgi:hypothetical protein